MIDYTGELRSQRFEFVGLADSRHVTVVVVIFVVVVIESSSVLPLMETEWRAPENSALI